MTLLSALMLIFLISVTILWTVTRSHCRPDIPLVDWSPVDDRGSIGTKQTNSSIELPYLVLDLTKWRISVEMTGVALREYPFEILSDNAILQDLQRCWCNPSATDRTIEGVYLLSSVEAVGQTEVSIIAEEAHLNRDFVQRHVPSRLVLVTSDNMTIQIETEIDDAQSHYGSQIKEMLSQIWRVVTGSTTLRIRLTQKDAMSLYGIVLGKPKIVSR